MNALATYSAAAIAPQSDLNMVYFNDFIRFIDRGERTTRTYITNLRQFAAWMRYADIARPVREDVINYREYLSSEHDVIVFDPSAIDGWHYKYDAKGSKVRAKCKPNTIAQYLRCVCQFFRWTAAEGLYPNIAENIHAPRVSNEQHKKEALTPQDVLTIEKSIAEQAERKAAAAKEFAKDTTGRIERATEQGKRLNAIYLLAVNCGLRTIEISRANVGDLEVKNGNAVLYIWGKGHTEADKKKPLAPEVHEAIKDYLDCRPGATKSEPLFVSTGNRSKGKRIAPTTISTMLKNAMQQAGYDSERITAHSLRHTTAQNVLAITGENIHKTQQYLRHSSPTTTQIYLRETENEQKQEADIAKQLYNYYHGQTAADPKQKLHELLERMSQAQLEQITNIAAAMLA